MIPVIQYENLTYAKAEAVFMASFLDAQIYPEASVWLI